MPEPGEVFVVESSFRVPGLGVLVLPAAPRPAWLQAYALHTALPLHLLSQGQPPQLLTGTVEELAHEGEPLRRALLLDFDPGGALLAGTQLQAGPPLPELL